MSCVNRIIDDRELRCALRLNSLHFIPSGEESAAIAVTPDLDGINSLLILVDLVEYFRRGKVIEYKLDNHQSFRNVLAIGEGSVQSLLCKAISNSLVVLERQFPCHKYDSRAELFISLLKDRPELRKLLHSFQKVYFGDEAVEVCTAINEFVRELSMEARSKEFDHLTKNRRRAANKNFLSTKRCIAKLCKKYPQILVVRLDFAYSPSSGRLPLNGWVNNLADVKSDFNCFLHSMKSDLMFRHRVGYIWKLEHSLERGFHYHLFVFFDGSKEYAGIELGRMMGRCWKAASRGNGIFVNHNALTKRRKDLGIRMVANTNPEHRRRLEEALMGVTKPDYLLCVDTDNAGRIFGKGGVKKMKITARTKMPNQRECVRK